MKATNSGKLYAPVPLDPTAFAYADGLTAARYMEPQEEDEGEPQAIPQEPNWKEG